FIKSALASSKPRFFKTRRRWARSSRFQLSASIKTVSSGRNRRGSAGWIFRWSPRRPIWPIPGSTSKVSPKSATDFEEKSPMEREVTASPTPLGALLITADELANLLGLSTRTVWRMHSAGRLPAPIKLGRAVRWRHKEIHAWIEAGCPDSWRDQQ